MAIKTAGIYAQQTGITANSDAIKLRPNKECAIAASLTSGSPATGAKIQVTLSPYAAIDGGTAIWVDYGSNSTTSQLVVSASGKGCMLTGCRLVATDGTWAITVRQGDGV